VRAELEKLRSLPTPRYTVAAAAGLLVAVMAIAWMVGPESWDDYETALEIAAGLGTAIASIVLAVWIVALEYGQGTVRRALTAEPRRGRLLTAKLAIGLGSVAALTVAVWALAIPLSAAATSGLDVSVEIGGIVDGALAALVSNLIIAAAGFGIALLTRSMAGAMTATLAFVLILDTALSAVPGVGEFTLGTAILAITEPISGEEGEYTVGLGVAIAAAWLVVLVGVGALRFTRGDAA
jgi:ABC-2 type transport system permease protein